MNGVGGRCLHLGVGVLGAALVLLASPGHARDAGVAADPAPAGNVAAWSHEIDAYYDAWRFAEADRGLAALEKAAPTAPQVPYLQGYQRFLRGDYDGAVRALTAATQATPNNADVRSLAALAKEAQGAIKDHREEKSPHTIIRYAPEDAVLVPYAQATVEAAYQALHEDLGFEVTMPIRVELYRSPSDLAAVTSLSQAEVARTGTIALCKWARLMVTTPRALAYGYPWLDTINHELVHYAVSTLTGDRAPVWLQEGLAKFLERRWREPPGGRIPPAMEHLLAKALRSGKLITFEAMHPSMAKLPSAEDATLAFAEVDNAVAFLHQKGGMPALRDAIKRVANGEDARVAVAAAAGLSWPEFERGWRAFMVAQHYKTFPAIDIATTHIRKPGAIASGRKPAEEDALSSGMKAGAPYRHLRLGNMLLKRERARAAVAEYERGAKALGPADRPHGDPAANWVFPVKLARTYLVLGEPDRALKALGGVQTLYPDLPWPNLLAGEALVAKGTPKEALAPLEASLAVNPFDPQVHCTLASAYGKLAPADRPPAATVAREQRFCKELAD
jgi:tetratricopeptide (TPR) repeat protein